MIKFIDLVYWRIYKMILLLYKSINYKLKIKNEKKSVKFINNYIF